MSEPLLQVKDLKIYYPVKAKNALGGSVSYLHAVDGVSFDVYKGETFGIVGESGCGKSTTGRGIVGLLEPTAGTILFEGKDIKGCSRREMARHIQIIFQDPYSSLDPRMTVGRCIEEPLDVHKVGIKSERWSKVLELMQEVGLREDQASRFPHEFSGGQRQRIGVARAIALQPDLVICDEPVSALDVSIQAQILNLMRDLQKKYNLTYILFLITSAWSNTYVTALLLCIWGTLWSWRTKNRCLITLLILTPKPCWRLFLCQTRMFPAWLVR